MKELIINIKATIIKWYINLKWKIMSRISKRNTYRKNRYYNSKVHKDIDEALDLLMLYYNNPSIYENNDNSSYNDDCNCDNSNGFNYEEDNDNSIYDWSDFHNSFDDSLDDDRFDSGSDFDSNFNN